jgi:hypothetical protein
MCLVPKIGHNTSMKALENSVYVGLVKAPPRWSLLKSDSHYLSTEN